MTTEDHPNPVPPLPQSPRDTPEPPPETWGPDERLSLSRVADALLKHPQAISREITGGRTAQTSWALLAILSLCLLAYGLVMGTFAYGNQLWAVPVKTLVGGLLAAGMCLPSLYILGCLAGARHSFGQTSGLLLQALALGGILLIGFAPVAWLFAQSTHSVSFMGVLHVVFWAIGAATGARLLRTSLHIDHRTQPMVVQIWFVLYVTVTLQMTTTLRPLVGAYDGVVPQEKALFIAHWWNTLAGR